MAKKLYEEASVQAIANAIRAKTGKTDTMTLAEMPDEIASIQTDRVLISFKDIDGTLIRAYTLDEIQALTALPAPPERDNLTFLGWTKTLEALKNYPHPVSVYPKFKVTDGKTRIWISFTSGNKSPTLRFSQTKASGVLIDWGDGSSERVATAGNVSRAHTYAGVGAYIITLTPDEDCTWVPNWGGSSSNTFMPGYVASITKVEFGDNVSALGDFAFYGASNISSILLPEGITIIPSNFCTYCGSLRHINIPSTVTTIKAQAFNNCASLTQIDLPEELTTVEANAFTLCHSLEKVIVPATCVNINSSSSPWLTGGQLTSAGPYGSGKSIEYLWDALPARAFAYNSYLTDIEFPPQCAAIPDYAFIGCTSLMDVNIPNTVVSIASGAFRSCSAICDLVIPNSVKSISSSAFIDCTNLEHVVIPKDLSSVPGGNNPILSGCWKLKTASPIGGGGNIEYGWKTAVLRNGFAQTAIEHITFPTGLKILGGFYGCKYLKRIDIPEGVTALSADCFRLCSNLETVSIPDSLIEVQTNAFDSCSRINELSLPHVTSLPSEAIFANMISLDHIVVGSVGYGVIACDYRNFMYTYNPSLVIEFFTTANYVDRILANIRNGAVSAKIIVKASTDTVYNGTTFAAGETILTSEVTS